MISALQDQTDHYDFQRHSPFELILLIFMFARVLGVLEGLLPALALPCKAEQKAARLFQLVFSIQH